MNKRTNITRKSVRAAVKHGARTMADVIRAHGYRSICRANSSKIRRACPDVDILLAQARGHLVIFQEARKRPTKIKKADLSKMFKGPLTEAIVRIGSQKKMDPGELDQAVLDDLSRSGVETTLEKIKFTRWWITNEHHCSNRRRTRNSAAAAAEGKVLIEAVS